MKKLTALALICALMLTLLVGCGKNDSGEVTEVAVKLPGSALEILETVWNAYGEDEKFALVGGNVEAGIADVPGNYDMTYASNMTYDLLVPADRIANVSEAASMIHMMNSNSFTCGVFKLNNTTAADFAAAMQQAVQGNRWMCGFPEKLLIKSTGDSYVLVAFGVNDLMSIFQQHFEECYPGFATLYNEDIL